MDLKKFVKAVHREREREMVDVKSCQFKTGLLKEDLGSINSV